jgi:hypothetical protein
METANNEENWATMNLLAVARTLELDADSTLKDLPDHAKEIMAELQKLRTAVWIKAGSA